MKPDELMLTSDAAKVLERTPGTVRNYAKRGLLRFSETPNGVRLFQRSEVERLAGLLRELGMDRVRAKAS